MSTASMLAWRLARSGTGGAHGGAREQGADVKYGDDIFGNGPYPRTLTDFVGQQEAKQQIAAAMVSSSNRDAAFPHMLLASGFPGIGKTALAKIVAKTLNVGYVEVGGTVTAKEIRPTLLKMQDHDVLFIDEIHRMVSSGKRNAEWLLQVLQDRILATANGTDQIADITIIAATTDMQKLPKTILGRFGLQPQMVQYTEVEAVHIAKLSGKQVGLILQPADSHRIAAASDYNPRMIRRIVERLRDIREAATDTDDDVLLAIKWAGQAPDGLSRGACDYLMLLFGYGGTAADRTLRAALNEVSLEHSEQTLIQRGYIQVTSRGRELTPLGVERAEQLMEENADG